MSQYFNGRILLREHGGVRRYASEVADRLENCTVLKPRSARYPWSARVWEQTTLARQSLDGALLSVAHSGPLLHRRHVFVVHDLLALSTSTSVRGSYSRLMRAQLPRLVRSARTVVAISRSVADQVADTFAVAPTRLAVAEPGISEVFQLGDRAVARTRLGLDTDRPVVAALLDPTPRKNSPQVVSVLERIQSDRPEVQVAVAGRTKPPAFAKLTATPPTRPSGFCDLGAATDAQLALMYQAADIFVSLSAAEGFGLPVIEAAASGAAVVSTRVPSVAEHARDGIVVVDGPAEALAQVMRLLDEPELRADLVSRALDRVDHLRWDRTATTLGAILSEAGHE